MTTSNPYVRTPSQKIVVQLSQQRSRDAQRCTSRSRSQADLLSRFAQSSATTLREDTTAQLIEKLGNSERVDLLRRWIQSHRSCESGSDTAKKTREIVQMLFQGREFALLDEIRTTAPVWFLREFGFVCQDADSFGLIVGEYPIEGNLDFLMQHPELEYWCRQQPRRRFQAKLSSRLTDAYERGRRDLMAEYWAERFVLELDFRRVDRSGIRLLSRVQSYSVYADGLADRLLAILDGYAHAVSSFFHQYGFPHELVLAIKAYMSPHFAGTPTIKNIRTGPQAN